MVNKKILTALAFIFLISLATAEVSHEADQIFFTDNDNLQQKFDNGDFGKWDDGTAAGDIYYDDGNVGIGTDAPSYLLEVTGRIKTGGTQGGIWIGEGDQFIGIHSTDRIGLWNNGEWRFTVKNDGNVGIGTINPSAATLHVYRPDNEVASIYATGSDQGTGMVYVGQSTAYGGGIVYDGDGSPDVVGGTDRITFFRRSNNNDAEVLSYSHGSGQVRIPNLAGCSANSEKIEADAEGDLVCGTVAVSSCSTCDSRFINAGGDTMTGNFEVTGGNTHLDNYVYVKDYDGETADEDVQIIARDGNLQHWSGGVVVGAYSNGDTTVGGLDTGDLLVQDALIAKGYFRLPMSDTNPFNCNSNVEGYTYFDTYEEFAGGIGHMQCTCSYHSTIGMYLWVGCFGTECDICE